MAGVCAVTLVFAELLFAPVFELFTSAGVGFTGVGVTG